jgi:hypothetical protein
MLSDLVIACLASQTACVLAASSPKFLNAGRGADQDSTFVHKKGDPNFRRDRQFYNYF